MQPLVIAHRGYTQDAPDNSLKAFRAAYEMGVDMIELDLHRTKDKIIVCCHDPDYKGKWISRNNYKDLIKKESPDLTMPTFESVARQAKGKIAMDIELKEGGYEKQVLQLLKREGFMIDEYMLSSFNAEVCWHLKELSPMSKVGLLLSGLLPSDWKPWEKFEYTGADLLIVKHQMANSKGRDILNEADLRKIPVMVWIVNGEEKLKPFLKNKNLAGVITDEPEHALAVRQEIALDI